MTDNVKEPTTALVEYKFVGEEHSITRPPHKNSKSTTPYKRTHPSTIQRIKEVAKDVKPSAAFELIHVEMQGSTSSDTGSGQIPYSKKQISDFHGRLFRCTYADELAVLIGKYKCLQGGTIPYVRCVQAAPQPLSILATDTQLKQA